MPSRAPSPRGSTFSTTFVLGTAAALWFAAAIVSGGTIPVLFALGWLAVLILDFGLALWRRGHRRD